jgi:hypothetical protein
LHAQNVNLHCWSSIVEFCGKHRLHGQNVNLHYWSSIVEFHGKPRLHVQNVNLCCWSSIVEFSVKHGLHMQNMNLCITELRKYAQFLDTGLKLTRAIALKEETTAFQNYIAGEVQTSWCILLSKTRCISFGLSLICILLLLLSQESNSGMHLLSHFLLIGYVLSLHNRSLQSTSPSSSLKSLKSHFTGFI